MASARAHRHRLMLGSDSMIDNNIRLVHMLYCKIVTIKSMMDTIIVCNPKAYGM